MGFRKKRMGLLLVWYIVVLSRTLFVTLYKVRRCLSFTRNFVPRTEDSLSN